MRPILLTITIAFAIGCGKAPSPDGNATKSDSPTPPNPISDDFFANWLKAHGHSDVVVDGDGVGVEDNRTRLKAFLYDSKKHPNGGYIAELQFTIRLPSGLTITEFVAGTGNTQEDAINDAKVNFVLSTFHVVYKGFINPDDPHLRVASMVINDTKRDIIMGDMVGRGAPFEQKRGFHLS